MPRRFVYATIGLLVLTAFYVCACRLPLIWDGAFQLSITLIRQHPFAYLTRFHTLIIWWPTVWASRITDSPMVLQTVFGLPFILAPALSVGLSWWLVRRHAPGLLIWVIFGLAAGTLPGQVFIINDSIWQQTLFWPLFVAVFVPLTWPQISVLAVLAIFQLVHQIGVPLLFGATVAAGIVAWLHPQTRDRWLIRALLMAGLFTLAVTKILVSNRIPWLRDTYAEREFSWEVAVQRYDWGVAGWPIRGLIFMWCAALAVFLHGHLRNRPARSLLGALSLACVLAAGGLWLYWAADGHRWYKALDYRRWILPLTFPFFAFALIEGCLAARRRAGADNTQTAQPDGIVLRAPLGLVLAAVFAAVLGMQSTVWARLLHRLQAQVNHSSQIAMTLESIPWVEGTPLDHWGSCDAITFLQGKIPRKLLVTDELFPQLTANPPLAPNQGWFLQPRKHPPPPGPAGWIDFSPVLKQLADTHPRVPATTSRPLAE